MSFFIAFPWAALVPAVGCAWLWWWRRHRSAAVATAAWVTYAGYEALMRARILCSGECNIRVDLLLLYPALALITLVALGRSMRAARRARPDH